MRSKFILFVLLLTLFSLAPVLFSAPPYRSSSVVKNSMACNFDCPIHPEIGFFGIDSVSTDRRGICMPSTPLPSARVLKPEGARSEYLAGMSSEHYLHLTKRYVNSGHREIGNILMYYWGETPNRSLAAGQGRTVSGSNFATWNASQLSELRTIGVTPFIALESLDPRDARSLVDRLRSGGFAGRQVKVRLAAEPAGSHYTRTPAEYRRRFEITSRAIKAMGRRAGIDIKIAFTICGIDEFRYTPASGAFDYIGIDAFVTPVNIDGVKRLFTQTAVAYPDKPLVIPEFGIATACASRRVPIDSAWSDMAAHLMLEILRESYAGRIASITPFDIDAKDRIVGRDWSWVWSAHMYQQLIDFAYAPATTAGAQDV